MSDDYYYANSEHIIHPFKVVVYRPATKAELRELARKAHPGTNSDGASRCWIKLEDNGINGEGFGFFIGVSNVKGEDRPLLDCEMSLAGLKALHEATGNLIRMWQIDETREREGNDG